MATAGPDVVGIGNALVDVIAHVPDEFLERHRLTRGAMTLIDAGRAEELYRAMPPAVEISGGSAANTMAGIASLGGAGAYIGKVGDDELGDVFRHDMRAGGVAFDVPPIAGAPTGRSLVCVTPDAQRTMQTFLGAAIQLQPSDVDVALIASAQVTYLEGYLWDPPGAKEAFLIAAAAARRAGRRVALTLSDPFCVERYRLEFVDLVEHHVDILFANEHEITALYNTNFDEALSRVRGACEVAALTRSERGSAIVTADGVLIIEAARVGPVVDTTGAGDQYAAGFLYAITHGLGLRAAGEMASLAAAEVISHFGARPAQELAQVMRDHGVAGVDA